MTATALATPPTTSAAPASCNSDMLSDNTSQPSSNVITGPSVDTKAT